MAMSGKHKLHCIKQRECYFYLFYDSVQKKTEKNPSCNHPVDGSKIAIPFSFALSVGKVFFITSYDSDSDVIFMFLS